MISKSILCGSYMRLPMDVVQDSTLCGKINDVVNASSLLNYLFVEARSRTVWYCDWKDHRGYIVDATENPFSLTLHVEVDNVDTEQNMFIDVDVCRADGSRQMSLAEMVLIAAVQLTLEYEVCDFVHRPGIQIKRDIESNRRVADDDCVLFQSHFPFTNQSQEKQCIREAAFQLSVPHCSPDSGSLKKDAESFSFPRQSLQTSSSSSLLSCVGAHASSVPQDVLLTPNSRLDVESELVDLGFGLSSDASVFLGCNLREEIPYDEKVALLKDCPMKAFESFFTAKGMFGFRCSQTDQECSYWRPMLEAVSFSDAYAVYATISYTAQLREVAVSQSKSITALASLTRHKVDSFEDVTLDLSSGLLDVPFVFEHPYEKEMRNEMNREQREEPDEQQHFKTKSRKYEWRPKKNPPRCDLDSGRIKVQEVSQCAATWGKYKVVAGATAVVSLDCHRMNWAATDQARTSFTTPIVPGQLLSSNVLTYHWDVVAVVAGAPVRVHVILFFNNYMNVPPPVLVVSSHYLIASSQAQASLFGDVRIVHPSERFNVVITSLCDEADVYLHVVLEARVSYRYLAHI